MRWWDVGTRLVHFFHTSLQAVSELSLHQSTSASVGHRHITVQPSKTERRGLGDVHSARIGVNSQIPAIRTGFSVHVDLHQGQVTTLYISIAYCHNQEHQYSR